MFLAFLSPLHVHSEANGLPEQSEIIGRWDLTVDRGGKSTPSWLEVKLSGVKTLVGFFVADGGSARPISKVNFQAFPRNGRAAKRIWSLKEHLSMIH